MSNTTFLRDSIYDCINFSDIIDRLYNVGFVHGILGIIGYTLLTVILAQHDFSEVSFVYHRAITYLELVHMPVVLYLAAIQHEVVAKSIFRTWFGSFFRCYLGIYLGNVLSNASDLITIMLSIERCFAVICRSNFARINTPKVAYTMVTVSFFISGALMSPVLVNKRVELALNGTGYQLVSTGILGRQTLVNWHYVLTVFNLFKGVILLVLTSMIIYYLAYRVRPNGGLRRRNSNFGQVRQRAENNLCYLQLCLAVPMLLHGLFLLLRSLVKTDQHSCGNVAELAKLLPTEGIPGYFRRKKAFKIIDFCNDLSSDVAHCYNFYVFVAFNRKIKRGMMRLFRSSESPAGLSDSDKHVETAPTPDHPLLHRIVKSAV